MDNPVVVRAAEVCAHRGLATLRFNFRGVGASTGKHGNGIAERTDIRSALDHLAATLPARALVALVGYSFGAAVAAQVAGDYPALAGLCLIAPPLGFTGMTLPRALAALRGPLAIVVGTQDEYCPAAALEALPATLPNARVTAIEGANHFFFGKLFPLGEHVATWAGAVLDLPRDGT